MFVLLYCEYLCCSETLTLWMYSFINNKLTLTEGKNECMLKNIFFSSSRLTHSAAKHTEGESWRETQAKCAGTNFKMRMFVPSVCAV